VKLIPPLVINQDDVRWFLHAFEDVMVKLHRATVPLSLLARLGRNAIFGGKKSAVQPSAILVDEQSHAHS
ncbi:MAG: hypothetical protein WCP80_10700, partial [Phycisphaerales bacterium]